MAMKALICPQCHAQLEPTEQDMKRGYSECPSCGTIVEFHEVQKVEYSGQVELSNIKQAKNRINLAQRAFKAQNYKEAYDYYTKVLEDIPDDILSLYRKGICAIYISWHIPEYTTNFSEANELLNKRIAELSPEVGKDQKKKNDLEKIRQQAVDETADMLKNISTDSDLFNWMQESYGECRQLEAQWCEVAKLYLAVINELPDKSIEKILSDGIAFCNKILHYTLHYHGTTRDKDGNVEDVIYDSRLDGDQVWQVNEIRGSLKQKLRSLPARVARKQRLESWIKDSEEELKRLSAERDAAKEKLDAATNQFWKDNPNLQTKRSSYSSLCIIFLLGGPAAAIYCYIKDMLTLFWCIVLSVVSLVIAAFFGGSADDLEKGSITTEVKALQEAFDTAEKKFKDKDTELTNFKNELARFEAEEK